MIPAVSNRLAWGIYCMAVLQIFEGKHRETKWYWVQGEIQAWRDLGIHVSSNRKWFCKSFLQVFEHVWMHLRRQTSPNWRRGLAPAHSRYLMDRYVLFKKNCGNKWGRMLLKPARCHRLRIFVAPPLCFGTRHLCNFWIHGPLQQTLQGVSALNKRSWPPTPLKPPAYGSSKWPVWRVAVLFPNENRNSGALVSNNLVLFQHVSTLKPVFLSRKKTVFCLWDKNCAKVRSAEKGGGLDTKNATTNMS